MKPNRASLYQSRRRKKTKEPKKALPKPKSSTKPSTRAALLPNDLLKRIESINLCLTKPKNKGDLKIPNPYFAMESIVLPTEYFESSKGLSLKTASISPILRKSKIRNPSSSLYADDPEALNDLNAQLEVIFDKGFLNQIGQDGNILYETLGNGRISKYALDLISGFEKLCTKLKDKGIRGRDLYYEALLEYEYLLLLTPDMKSCIAIVIFGAGDLFPTKDQFFFTYLGIRPKRLSLEFREKKNMFLIRTSHDHYIVFSGVLNDKGKIEMIDAQRWTERRNYTSQRLYSLKQMLAFAGTELYPRPNPTELKEIEAFILTQWNDKFIPKFKLRMKLKSNNESLSLFKVLPIFKTDFDEFNVYICYAKTKSIYQSYVMSYYPPTGRELLVPRHGMPKIGSFADLESAVKFGNVELKDIFKGSKEKPNLSIPVMQKHARELLHSSPDLIGDVVANFTFPSDLDLDFDEIELL